MSDDAADAEALPAPSEADLTPSLPVVVLVGRPNVGKSTLFNRLTGTRDALVANLPGLTRDRQYGEAQLGDKRFIVVDTGGLMPESSDPLAVLAEDQARIALEEADHILFLVDGHDGWVSGDAAIANQLRKLNRPLTLLVNKTEGRERSSAGADFHQLGLGEPQPISAEHGHGVTAVLSRVLEPFPPIPPPELADDGRIRVAVVGRPNVGKSTLVNRLLGEERVLAADLPGTTRDAIAVPFEYEGHPYTLIDTAGVRRRSRIEEMIEKFSIVKTLQAIDSAHVVIMVVDAQQDIADQDARLIGLVANRGRALILAVNKWDGLSPEQREQVRYRIGLKLPFLDYAPLHFISARHGSGVGVMMREVAEVYDATMRELGTAELNRVLAKALEQHQPPAVLGRRIKLRYANQGGRNPTRIIVHGNQTEKLPDSYRRYLINEFRRVFKLKGVPLLLEFRTGDNPFKGRKNELSDRQRKKRQRLMRHTRK